MGVCDIVTVGKATQCAIFVIPTGCMDFIHGELMAVMKGEAILCNIGHFDREITVSWLELNLEVCQENIKPRVGRATGSCPQALGSGHRFARKRLRDL